MRTPNAVRNVAALAPGKGVRIVGPDGIHRILSADDAEPTPEPSAAITAKLAELDAQVRATVGIVAALAATVNAMAERAAAAITAIKTVADATTANQTHIERSLDALERTMAMPTKPVYDAKGLLIGARRVDKL